MHRIQFFDFQSLDERHQKRFFTLKTQKTWFESFNQIFRALFLIFFIYLNKKSITDDLKCLYYPAQYKLF